MQNFINDSLLKDLNHPSDPQIRKKALHSISESLKNNVIFKNPPKYNKSAAQELKFVNFTILIRNLIRYFGHGVQEEESEILDLLLLIMKVKLQQIFLSAIIEFTAVNIYFVSFSDRIFWIMF